MIICPRDELISRVRRSLHEPHLASAQPPTNHPHHHSSAPGANQFRLEQTVSPTQSQQSWGDAKQCGVPWSVGGRESSVQLCSRGNADERSGSLNLARTSCYKDSLLMPFRCVMIVQDLREPNFRNVGSGLPVPPKMWDSVSSGENEF